jgi:hypothetical protein
MRYQNYIIIYLLYNCNNYLIINTKILNLRQLLYIQDLLILILAVAVKKFRKLSKNIKIKWLVLKLGLIVYLFWQEEHLFS